MFSGEILSAGMQILLPLDRAGLTVPSGLQP